MSNDFVTKIDLVRVNEDGTIEVIDSPSWTEYPFKFQYKLYLPFVENLKSIFQRLYSIPPEHFKLSNRFIKYVENREALYAEVSKEYLPIINEINQSSKTPEEKRHEIEKIDLKLNQLYPYYEEI